MSTEAQFTDNNIPTNPALLIGGWEVVIGLEIHAQLTTQSKLFSGSAIAYGAAPNTQASEVDLALPGVLPVLNKQVLEMAAKLGIALEAHMGEFSVFDRKNYFYPDLPQGYQISQLDYPVVGLGHLDVTLDDGTVKRVGVTRAHLEQDAGKSLHEDYAGMTGIDLNRAGTPLLEIVSEPDLRSSKEAVAYMKKMHELVQYLGICDGNMQEGSFRCDANVSVRQPGDVFGTRAELKNINSFKNIEKAIDFEINRQIDLLESGQSVVQETRLYDPDQNVTRSMRSKEEANDYRYFPDPDLLPVAMPREFIEQVRKTMPEMADSKRARYINEYQLSEYDADLLSGDRLQAEYFEQLLSEGVDAKQAANWMMGELASALNEAEMNISEAKVSPAQLAQLIARISDDTISGKIAKQVFAKMWQTGNAADSIIESEGLKQITDTGAIEAIIDQVIADNPEQVEQYRGGAEKVLGFFVGQVMKASQGKANPGQVNQMLKQKLT